MKNFIFILMLGTALAGCVSKCAHASDVGGDGARLTCGQYLAALPSDGRAADSWILGFVSGYADRQARAGQNAGWAPKGQESITMLFNVMKRMCERHPEVNLAEMVDGLADYFVR